jgi:hypothetical protein
VDDELNDLIPTRNADVLDNSAHHLVGSVVMFIDRFSTRIGDVSLLHDLIPTRNAEVLDNSALYRGYPLRASPGWISSMQHTPEHPLN